MQKLYRPVLIVAALSLTPALASAGELKLTIANGLVTLIATDVPVRQILDEWSRVGGTRIVGADKLTGPAVTIELRDVPEGKALETLLRSASGYMAARRRDSVGASLYDRITIMPFSRGPAPSASTAPFTTRTAPPPIAPPPIVDDDEQPVVPPGSLPPGMQQFPGVPGMVPGMSPNQGQQPQPVLTAPRPGQLPLPSPVPGQPNPYQPNTNPQLPVRPPGGGPGGGPGGQ
jgi:hypothetical protein